MLTAFSGDNFQLPIMLQKTQSVVARLESFGYFSTVTALLVQGKEHNIAPVLKIK